MPDAHHIHKHSFLGFLPSYLARQAQSQVKELFLHAAILDLAVAMILFFEPIYLFQKGLSLFWILVFYLGVYTGYLFLMPLGGKFAKKYGFEHSIFLGSPFLILFYLSLALMSYSLYFALPAILFYALQKTFYWPGYHADFAAFGKDSEQGREISNITIIISLVFILGPLLGGAILHFWGFFALFIVVSLLIIISNFPLLLTPERFVPAEFSYSRAFKRLVSRENRRSFLAYLGFGEDLVLLALWPIFIFTVLKTTLSVGAMIALSTLVTSLVVLYVGKLTDKRKKRPLLRFASMVYAIGWLLRLLVRAPIGVFLVDTFSRIGKSAHSVPLIALTYHRARERGVVKNVIFFEMALCMGKILCILLILLMIALLPGSLLWPGIFVLAGLFTLLYGLL